MEREKNISVVMDEVHTNQSVEYVGGKFFGNENNEITKKLFSVMVKSLGGRYKDMVAMQPVATLNSGTMKTIFMNVLKGLTEIGFTTCAVLVYGNRINMKFYKDELCDGKMKYFVDNPFKTGDKIFLLYDTPHIFKCLYNIFLSRNELICPAFGEFTEIRPVLCNVQCAVSRRNFS